MVRVLGAVTHSTTVATTAVTSSALTAPGGRIIWLHVPLPNMVPTRSTQRTAGHAAAAATAPTSGLMQLSDSDESGCGDDGHEWCHQYVCDDAEGTYGSEKVGGEWGGDEVCGDTYRQNIGEICGYVLGLQ